jgi:hypothetical protein
MLEILRFLNSKIFEPVQSHKELFDPTIRCMFKQVETIDLRL